MLPPPEPCQTAQIWNHEERYGTVVVKKTSNKSSKELAHLSNGVVVTVLRHHPVRPEESLPPKCLIQFKQADVIFKQARPQSQLSLLLPLPASKTPNG